MFLVSSFPSGIVGISWDLTGSGKIQYNDILTSDACVSAPSHDTDEITTAERTLWGFSISTRLLRKMGNKTGKFWTSNLVTNRPVQARKWFQSLPCPLANRPMCYELDMLSRQTGRDLSLSPLSLSLSLSVVVWFQYHDDDGQRVKAKIILTPPSGIIFYHYYAC